MKEAQEKGRRRRWLRWCGYLAATGLACVLCVLVAINWSHHTGKRELETTLTRLKAEGVELDWRKIHPVTEESENAKRLLAAGELPRETALANPAPMVGAGVFASLLDRTNWTHFDVVNGQATNMWTDWNRGVELLRIHRRTLDKYTVALADGPPRFAIDYDDHLTHQQNSHVSLANRSSSWFAAAFLVHLGAGEMDEAHARLMELLFLSRGLAREPAGLPGAVACNMFGTAFKCLAEALPRAHWTPEQWRALQEAFADVDWLAERRRAVQMEFALGVNWFLRIDEGTAPVPTDWVNWTPPGWLENSHDKGIEWLGEMAPGLATTAYDWSEGLGEWTDRRLFAPVWKRAWLAKDALAFVESELPSVRAVSGLTSGPAFTQFTQTLRQPSESDDERGYHERMIRQLSSMLEGGSVMPGFFERHLVAEHRAHLAATVCAIQRHVLVKGGPPAELVALVPEFMEVAPFDPGDGRPLRYSLNPDGAWRLYSTGLDGIDDGGDGNPVRGRRFDPVAARDILWPRPATQEEIEAYDHRQADRASENAGR